MAQNPRKLAAPLTGWRIGDPDGAFPVFSADGAALVSGRWHELGQRVIYVAEHYGTALLEKLVYCGVLPPNQHEVEVTVPSGCSYEVVNPERLPNWFESSGESARAFGSRWYEERRSVVLIVPSVVTRRERNFVLNASHREFERVSASLEVPVHWDARLFAP